MQVGLILVMLGTSVAGAREDDFKYDSQGRRDPFGPLVRDGKLVGTILQPRVNVEVPVLYGILWDPDGNSIAIINDEEVRAGDTIGGFRVAEIREDVVVLNNGSEPVVLRIEFETPVAP